MRSITISSLLGLLSLVGLRTASARCYSDEQCPSWQICTVSLGECGSHGELAVCTGRCVRGERFAFVPRLGMSALDGDLGASAGLEVVPPLFGGRLGVAVDYWTQSLVRAGIVATTNVLDLMALGLRVDVTRGDGVTGAIGALRLEAAPVRQVPLSLFAEGGVARANDTMTPMFCVGIAAWL